MEEGEEEEVVEAQGLGVCAAVACDTKREMATTCTHNTAGMWHSSNVPAVKSLRCPAKCSVNRNLCKHSVQGYRNNSRHGV